MFENTNEREDSPALITTDTPSKYVV
jgi:hypothetical protein